jgi:hypothetical protein
MNDLAQRIWQLFRPEQVCATIGAVGLLAAGWLAVRYAAIAADPLPSPEPISLSERPPTDPRNASAEYSWAQLRARLQAEAAEQYQTARAARRAETVQGCGIAAGVGLAFVGLGLVISGRRTDRAEAAAVIEAMRRRDEMTERLRALPQAATRGAGGTGTGMGESRVDPTLPGIGWPDRVVRHTPGVLALVCGAVLIGYAGAGAKTPTPTAPTVPAFPSPYGAMAVQPQAFPAFAP